MLGTLWRSWGRLWITCGSLWMTTACGDDDAASRALPEALSGDEAAPSSDEASPEEALDEEIVDPPADLAEPNDREQLEAACFHGSTEACDRLGH